MKSKNKTHRGDAEARSQAKLLSLDFRLERADDIPAWGGFLQCKCQDKHSHVILLNVQALMDPVAEFEDGPTVPLDRDDRKRTIITTLMHEFGHALEYHFKLPVNEDAIEAACEAWESAYEKARKGKRRK